MDHANRMARLAELSWQQLASATEAAVCAQAVVARAASQAGKIRPFDRTDTIGRGTAASDQLVRTRSLLPASGEELGDF